MFNFVKYGKRQRQSLNLIIKPTSRVLIFSGLLSVVAFAILFIYINLGTSKKVQAGLGMSGAKTISTTNVILNEFTTLSADAAAGATSITVGSSTLNANGRFSGSLASGELVMIIQMQGATLTTTSATSVTWGAVSAYNNSGKYEFDEVSGVPDGTHITLTSALKNSYTSSGKVQVIRVPRYTDLTINSGASLSTDAWNGSTGGIIAVEVNDTTTINGTIDVSGKGFRGGTVQNNSVCCSNGADSTTYATSTASAAAQKGEGIGGDSTVYKTLTGGQYGRGAAANGGGGGCAHNGGGGGGANSGTVASWDGLGTPDTTTVSAWKTAWDQESTNFHKHTSSGGGRGGYTYSTKAKDPMTYAPGNSNWQGDNRSNVGGLGGRPLDNSGNRIFLGGGGGAGDSNNGIGTNGGNGGGIVCILGGQLVTGTGTISANGSTAATASSGVSSGDAAGGGGGGGSVMIYTNGATISNLTINANGGTGGGQSISTNECEGPGGGGAGGYINTTNGTGLTKSVTGAHNGTTSSSALTTFLPNGATMANSGVITSPPSNPYSGTVTLPITLKNFSGEEKNNTIELEWTTEAEINNDFFTLAKSTDGYDFRELTKVKGVGNSTHEINYSYTDDSPVQRDNYYRLTQTDFDGKSKTFNPIHIRINEAISCSTILSVYPVLFNDHLKIDYSMKDRGTIEFLIINNAGQVIKTKQAEAGAGVNSFTFDDVSALPAGTYIVLMKNGDATTGTTKVLKL